MAVAVVDVGGHLVYFERMQDAQIGSVELAIEKAKTSALFRRPTKLFCLIFCLIQLHWL